MTLQILSYEFLGPIKLSEWGPPMEEVVYLILKREKDTFGMLYAGESGKTDDAAFFTKNDQFKCWVSSAGEGNLYLAIYPMWGTEQDVRARIVRKIIAKYNPSCNKA